MSFYRVIYQSMTASYGPTIIEADDESSARKIFASRAFSKAEMPLIRARKLNLSELREEIRSEDK